MTPPPAGRKRGVSRLVELFERPRSNSTASTGHALLSAGADANSDVGADASAGGRANSPRPGPSSAAGPGSLRINLPVRRGTVKERVEAFSSPLVGEDEQSAAGSAPSPQRARSVAGSTAAKSEGWGSLVRNVEREIADRRRVQNGQRGVMSPVSPTRPPLSPIPSASGSGSGPNSSAGHSVLSATAPSFASQPDSPPPPLTPESELAMLPLLPLRLPTQAPAPPRLVSVSELFSRDANPLLLPTLDKALDAVRPLKMELPKEWRSRTEKAGWDEWLADVREEGWWDRVKGKVGRGKAGVANEKGPALVAGEGATAGGGEVKPGSREERELILPPMHLVPPKLTVTDLKSNRLKPPGLFTSADVLEKLIDWPLAAESSNWGLSLETITSIRDVIQMCVLLSHSIASLSDQKWYQALFVDIPAAIGLDFVSIFNRAILWLWVFTAVAFWCLYEFYRLTGGWSGERHKRKDQPEGFDGEATPNHATTKPKWRDSRWYTILVTFVAGSLYLPLSKLALGALFWTDDFWAIDNPYSTTDNPAPAPLGSSSDYYDTLNFCYRTTMHKPAGIKHVNWAVPILIVAAITVLALSVWFPLRVWRVIRGEAPEVDKFTEMGRKRADVEGEYWRLLDADTGPWTYLYQAYRRSWRHYKSIYMLIKLLNVLVITLITKDNCVFRHRSRLWLGIVRQGSLLAFMSLYFLLELWSAPYISLPANHSDLVSRGGYVVIVFFGLMTALGTKGQKFWSGGGLVGLNVIIYAVNAYFSLIGLQIVARAVKRLQYHLDFSIDLFSPRLDPHRHLTARVHQETLAAILLAGPEYKMPKTQQLAFNSTTGLSPYLLDFTGTPAERLVESLKTLRHFGGPAYRNAVSVYTRTATLREQITRDWTGPDVYFTPRAGAQPVPPFVTTFFGRVDVLPFPFQVVMRWDQDAEGTAVLVLTEEADWRRLVDLNESEEVAMKRRVRLGLRALEGVPVSIPFSTGRSVLGRQQAGGGVRYERGVIKIKRNSAFTWGSYNHNSGFQVSIAYHDGLTSLTSPLRKATFSAAEVLQLSDSFAMTTAIYRLFSHHKHDLEARMLHIETLLEQHRNHFAAEGDRKQTALSPAFLTRVYNQPGLSTEAVDEVLKKTEADDKVTSLVQRHAGSMELLQVRMEWLGQSKVHAWWALLWDEVWRRNQQVTELVTQPASFSPHYRSSVCYQPMSRPSLEAFLRSRGFGARGWFHSGWLNRVYFYLAELVASSDGAVEHPHLHLGRGPSLHSFNTLFLTPDRSRFLLPDPLKAQESLLLKNGTYRSAGTGDGTDFAARPLRPRAQFKFEQVWAARQPNRVQKGVVDWFALGWLTGRPLRQGERLDDVEIELVATSEGWELPPEEGAAGFERDVKDPY